MESLELLTVKEVAQNLKLKEWKIREMAKNRQLPHIKMGYRTMRFDPSEIEKFIRKHSIPVKNEKRNH